ncbi:MAG: hypothetical protein DCF15_16465 [Phormidesmis priestleyi]|uniref:Uncharacterized protein n=1 Tax=Phormidesmis priestleyi TaxID=268141 RepID=A0A2W4YSF6_9CYAN|nr:MAG: hypothetical protein DCF15_16465 [Phormidesmis priestleyi]
MGLLYRLVWLDRFIGDRPNQYSINIEALLPRLAVFLERKFCLEFCLGSSPFASAPFKSRL